MGQTGIIFFALIVGFVVFITLKKELGAYLGTLGLGSGAISGAVAGETTEQRAKRLAAELAADKAEASRINDSLKPIGGLPNIHT